MTSSGPGERSPLHRIWGPAGLRLLVGDAVVLSLLVAGIVAASLPRAAVGRNPCAEVVASGGEPLTLDLAKDGVHEVLGPIGVTRVEVRDGRVGVLSSPCPRQICRHGGRIGAPGELLVCLPNQIVIRIPGERADGPAAVSR